MAKIYARQGKFTRLLELWKAPPVHLTPILEKHALDISLLTVDILSSAQQYELLEKHILDLIEDALTALGNDDFKPLQQLCAARANVWSYLIDATAQVYAPEQ
jgi:N-terminal acetyltransferase B complex non-catalytic subunit